MTIKEYLSQAITLDKAIDSAILRLEKWKRFSIKTQSYYNAGFNSANKFMSSVERIIEKIIEVEAQINRDIDNFVNAQKEIKELINRLKDPKQRIILEMYYLAGEDWTTVAEKTSVSLRTVYNQHNKALKKLELIYFAEIRSKKLLPHDLSAG